MRTRIVTCVAMPVLSVVLAGSARLTAQSQQNTTTPMNYFVVNLGTPLGGTIAGANSINSIGWISGGAYEAGNASEHAVLWLGAPVDLGTLGGPNSEVAWPNRNDSLTIVGIAETANANPLGENWSCSAFFPTITHQICLGFVWQGGIMSPLPTLGGYDGYAAGANNLGQVVGWAENTVHDSTCVAPQVLQFEAVVWEPSLGQMHQLPPFPGDPDSSATAINDNGQVVGISGTCDNAVGEFSAAHALLWENGAPINLGSLGGVAWNTPTAINNHGEVVGFSDLAGDESGQPNYNAFRWTKAGGMQNLKTLPGDSYSAAYGINEQGQIVGQSINADGSSRAFLWQNGAMTDLNTLISPSLNLSLVYANDINASGEIVGQACVVSNGVCTSEMPAFLLVPTSQPTGDNATQVTAAAVSHSGKAIVPDSVRLQFRPRSGTSGQSPSVRVP